jgi:hypothetical protein
LANNQVKLRCLGNPQRISYKAPVRIKKKRAKISGIARKINFEFGI